MTPSVWVLLAGDACAVVVRDRCHAQGTLSTRGRNGAGFAESVSPRSFRVFPPVSAKMDMCLTFDVLLHARRPVVGEAGCRVVRADPGPTAACGSLSPRRSRRSDGVEDIRKRPRVVNRLVDNGNTVIGIERKATSTPRKRVRKPAAVGLGAVDSLCDAAPTRAHGAGGGEDGTRKRWGSSVPHRCGGSVVPTCWAGTS
ncbi:hypothetical protein GCM10027068_22400 [Prescottella soli]